MFKGPPSSRHPKKPAEKKPEKDEIITSVEDMTEEEFEREWNEASYEVEDMTEEEFEREWNEPERMDPGKLEVIEEEKEPEEDQDELPEEQRNFIKLLKNTLVLRDPDITTTNDEIIVDLRITGTQRTLRTQALAQTLIDAKIPCEEEKNAKNQSMRVIIKLPIPRSLTLNEVMFSLRGDQKSTQAQFGDIFKNNYIKIVAKNPTKTKEPVVDPTYAKSSTKDEELFIKNMQELQPFLDKLLNKHSPEVQWVKKSKHVTKLENLTNEMLKAMQPFDSGRYSPPAAVSYDAALRNLKQNPTLMVNFMRTNPSVYRILKENMVFLKEIQRDFSSQRPAPIKVSEPKHLSQKGSEPKRLSQIENIEPTEIKQKIDPAKPRRK